MAASRGGGACRGAEGARAEEREAQRCSGGESAQAAEEGGRPWAVAIHACGEGPQ